MANETQTTNWPDLAISLYDRLTGRGAEIAYEFENVDVKVPSGTGNQSQFAQWSINGTVRVRTRDRAEGK